jgi:hypothetical protein
MIERTYFVSASLRSWLDPRRHASLPRCDGEHIKKTNTVSVVFCAGSEYPYSRPPSWTGLDWTGLDWTGLLNITLLMTANLRLLPVVCDTA